MFQGAPLDVPSRCYTPLFFESHTVIDRHSKPLRLELLESRRVLAAPDVTGLTIQPPTPEAGDHLTIEATVTDADDDLRDVSFYIDDGDDVFTAADQIIGTDSDGADGWQFAFPTAGPYRILPLGDSITQPEAIQQSYRYPLWQNLIDAQYDFDFVGSQTENHAGSSIWPEYMGQTFDQDHEGHYGWRTDEVLASLPTWLSSYTPDVVLVHLGTNDLFQSQSNESTLNELEQIITELRQDNPNVVVFVAQLIPANFPSNALIDAFNLELPAKVQQWTTSASPVILVDQNSGIDPVAHLYDGVHPNATGEQIMADVWQQALEAARPIKDPAGVFTIGEHTFFAIASDELDNKSTPYGVSIDLGDPNNQEPTVLLSESSDTLFGTEAGEHTQTHESDDQYHEITEAENGSIRLVQTRWKFTVPGGVVASLHLEAHHNSANERFYFNYSTDGTSFANLLSVTKTTDDNQVQIAQLPEGISGDVWIQVRDSQLGDAIDDTIFVDYMALHLEGEPEPTLPEVSISTVSQASEAGPTIGQMVVSRTGDTSQPLNVAYVPTGNATEGTDYETLSGSVTIPIGSSQATINVTPIDDPDEEGNENVIVTISPNPAYDIGGANQAIVSIADDEVPSGVTQYLAIYESTLWGSASGLGATLQSDDVYEELVENQDDRLLHTWEFDIPAGSETTFVLEGYSSSEGFYVNYSVDDSNYRNMMTVTSTTDQIHTFTLPAGIAGCVFVNVRDANPGDNNTDTMFVDQVYIEVNEATVLPQVSVNASQASVGEAGGTPGQFTISRTGDVSQPLSVDFSVAGSATPGDDYTALPTHVDFTAGMSVFILDVVPVNDDDDEGNETVDLVLGSDPTYDILPTASSAIVSIVDDDSTAADLYAVTETNLAGSQNGSFTDTFVSDNVREELVESAGGVLFHQWQFQVAAPSSVTIHLEGFTPSTSDVFWVNYSNDGINFANFLTINSSTETVRTVDLPQTVDGSFFIQIRDSNRNADTFADSVFIDELKLIIDSPA